MIKRFLITLFIVFIANTTLGICAIEDNEKSPVNERFIPIEAADAPLEIPKKPTKTKKNKKNKAPAPTVDIISDYLDYFPEEEKIVASGNAMAIPEDKLSKLKADKITYYKLLNEIVAEGNVKLIKANNVVYGSFIRVKLNEDNAFMRSPSTQIMKIRIAAEDGEVHGKDLELNDGILKMPHEQKYILQMKSAKTGFEAQNEKEYIKLSESEEYKKKAAQKAIKVKTKEIIVDSNNSRDFVTLKGTSIYKNNRKVATIANMKLTADKTQSDIETAFPEIGYLRQLGLYAGPGFLISGPMGSTVKLAPMLVVDDKVGIGGMARLRAGKNVTEMYYGTEKDKFIIDGTQKFADERFRLNYATNAYVDDGFLGRKMPNKFAEIEFKDSTTLDDLGLVYDYRYSAALASDYEIGGSADWRMNTSRARRNLPSHKEDWSTLKLKAQGEFYKAKPLWEKKDIFELNARVQYDFSQYGTGQNLAVVRVGPTFLYTPTSRLRLRGGYFVSGVHGESPFSWDQYYYGKQSANIGYEVKVTKRLSLGASHTVNLLKDNFDERMLAENRVYARYGPEDMKFILAYDTVRRRTLMGFDMIVGADNSDVHFDKLYIKDYKNLNKRPKKPKKKEERV